MGSEFRMLLDIPQAPLLPELDVDHLLASVRREWGNVEVTGVVLPLIDDGGVYAETSDFALSDHSRESVLTTAERCHKRGLEVYFSVVPTGGFLTVPHLSVIDIAGDSSAHLCVNIKATQEMLIRVVNDALELSTHGNFVVSGIVLDICDLWPMSATEGRLELTCFCEACRDSLKAGNVNIEWFQKFPSPWNLVLQDSGTGISHLSNIRSNVSPQQIVELSRAKGLTKLFDTHQCDTPLDVQAERLIKFMDVRNRMVLKFVRAFFDGIARRDALRKVVVTEGTSYDWTSGVFFDSLDDPSICDEVWTDPTDHRTWTKNVAMRHYLWRRARYLLDHFTGLWRQSQDPVALFNTGLGRLGREGIRMQLQKRMGQTLGGKPSGRYFLRSLPAGEQNKGFVAVAFDAEIAKRLIDRVTPRDSLADFDPAEKRS